MHALDSSSANRKIGFSIQGKVKRRAGTSIKECWIQDVAVTPAPVNTTTWAEIAKSLSAQPWSLNKGNNDTTDDKEENEEKALSASGSPLVPESLEGKQKEVRKSLTFDDAVTYIQETRNISDRSDAESIAKIAFSIYKE